MKEKEREEEKMEKRRRRKRRRGIIKKSGNRAGLSMRRVAGSTQINGRHEGQFFAAPQIFLL